MSLLIINPYMNITQKRKKILYAFLKELKMLGWYSKYFSNILFSKNIQISA